MLPDDTLRRIRQIEIQARRLVRDSAFAGAYQSVFKGRGMTFESVRPYQPGDDVRDIDWNVTARESQAYVKQFSEERELTILIVLDSSSSCLFGTQERTKRTLAVEIGAVIALAAIANNDKVGLMIFSEKIDLFIAPRKGRNHILRIIRDLLTVQPAQAGTDIGMALQTVNRLSKQRAVVFFISDFLASSEEYSRELLVAAQKHDLIAVMLRDPLEMRWPDVGLVRVRDAETGEMRWIDTGNSDWRVRFRRQVRAFAAMRDSLLKQAQVDVIDIPVDSDYVIALMRFFQRRAKRL